MLLVLNEVRGAIMVAMLLTGGTHLFGSATSLQDLNGRVGSALACGIGAARC